MKNRNAFFAVVFMCACLSASAQPPGISYQDKSVDFAHLDLSVPESPAFVILGLSPENVVRPGDPRAFALSLLNGVDANGNFQSGLALDTAPFMLFFGNELTIKEYRESKMTRFLSRMQLSFASSKGVSEEDEATRVAGGLRLTIFDRGDPRMDTQMDDAFDKAAGDFRHFPPPVGSPEEIERRKREIARIRREDLADFRARVEEIQDESRLRNWNRSSWVLGLAPSWINEEGGSFHWNGLGVWSSIAYGFEGVRKLEESAQFIAHVRYVSNEHVPFEEGDNVFYSQDSLLVGGRLRFGTPTFNGSIEAAFVQAWPQDFDDDQFYKIAFLLEKRIADGFWLNVSLGRDMGNDLADDEVSILGAVRFGWNSKPNLTVP